MRGTRNLTYKDIPKHRLEYIELRLRQFIKTYKIRSWPIDSVQLVLIIMQEGHADLIVKSVRNIPDKIDAATVYDAESNSYVMLVNRNKMFYPFKSSWHRRLNFTLAHEIGHIILKHCDIPDAYKSANEKAMEDIEADEFAGRLLMPSSRIDKCNFTSLSSVAQNFNVSEGAMYTRLKVLGNEGMLQSKVMDVCETCGNTDISYVDRYCKVCGTGLEKHSMGVITMKYIENIIVNENQQIKKCPRCGNVDISLDDEFCSICGFSAYNYCTSRGRHVNTPNARFCTTCGSKTTYFTNDFLLPWDTYREMMTNLLEYESTIAGGLPTTLIHDWITSVQFLSHKGHHLLATLLENSRATVCGKTLVICLLDDAYLDKLSVDNNQYNSIVLDHFNNLYPSYNIDTLKFVSFEEFNQKNNTNEELPF